MTKGNISINGIEAKPGTKEFGYQRVRLPTEVRTWIPIGIVNGIKDGPVLCLLAGHHGMEYPGIEAVIRAFNTLNPKELKGSVITVPVVNLLGFYKKTQYCCPIDGVNIARIYPGDPNGSLAYVIAHTVLNDIVLKADYAIDCHGGDLFETLAPFTAFCTGVGEKAVAEKAEGMAKAFGIPYSADARMTGMNLMEEAPKRGVPTLLAEIGGEGKWDETSIQLHTIGIENVMKYLKMIEGTPKIQIAGEYPRGKTYSVRTKSGGIWYPQVKAGDKVSKDEILGEIKDLDGTVKEIFRSPFAGIVSFAWTYHVYDPYSSEIEPGYAIMSIISTNV